MARANRGRQPSAPMEAVEVVRLLDLLEGEDLVAWLDGGWGVDALLERRTRSHDDLDLVVVLDDVPERFGVDLPQKYAQRTLSATGTVATIDSAT